MESTVIKIRGLTIPVVRIEASKLLLLDDFMQYDPQTDSQLKLYKWLSEMIPKGLKDFYKPIFDPSLDRFNQIAFVEGKTPAIGKTYSWWEKAAEELAPEWGSRLGTDEEYAAFLGVLIKELSKVPNLDFNPWRSICDDSTDLGHYWNSKDAKEDFEKTGRRRVLEFFDLANTFKVMKSTDGNQGYCIGSGAFVNEGYKYPISTVSHRFRNSALGKGVGWIVFDGRKK